MNRVDEAKEFCLKKAKNYEGKLGAELLTQMMLSIEKKMLEVQEITPKYNKEAFLVGIYFHDIGRTINDGDEHPEIGFKIFTESFEKKYSEEEIKIIKDCCLNHGSDSKPQTIEGKLLQILDKSIVFEPEVMILVLKALVLKHTDWNIAYDEFIEKMNKWYLKIPDDATRNMHKNTLKYLIEIKNK